ncbi:DUF4328 domain-containing protein [Streptomyces sp. PT12]|uniref:protein kinase domain-containing protein n=1 Tax=Streptomyces sp. PT12 TaxID=1510197 RepID=UPI000DE30F60|nr:DUF4328 domain-containing protein [Streptomyces sp. PT12]RBM13139.1 serine/threonine protein kinase [Streptomyces sp. PT12]
MRPLRADDPGHIADYRLLGRLGEGGMGVVYLARSPRGRMVAVKTIRAEYADIPDFRRRFAKETAVAQRVGGRWTAAVLAADPDAALPWVATEYVAGLTLHQVVDEYGPLPEHAVRALASGLGHALGDIHAAGLAHRDLKPSNVMVTIERPRVIDFGIVRALDLSGTGALTTTGLTSTGVVIGSPGFMSPEQARGERLTDASDVFSLGAVLAFAATGRPPFHAEEGQPHALLYRVVHEPPDLVGVPDALLGLVGSCLAKDPAARPKPAELRERDEALPRPPGPWLPPEVLARLGQEAVRLLERDDPGTRTEPVADAPTEPARPSVPPPPTAPLPTAPDGGVPPPRAEGQGQGAGSGTGTGGRRLADQRRDVRGWSRTDAYRRVLYGMLTFLALASLASTAHLLSGLAGSGRSEAVDRVGDLWIWELGIGDRSQRGMTYVLLGARALAAAGLVVCWLLWFHQVRATAERFVPGGLRYQPRTAVTSWFVPIGNLFLPKQIANDVWHASGPPRPGGGMGPAAPLHAWWFLWLVTLLTWPAFWTPWFETINRRSDQMFFCETRDAEGDCRYVEDIGYWYEFEPLTWLILAAHLLVVPAVVVTALYVRRLTALQTARARG